MVKARRWIAAQLRRLAGWIDVPRPNPLFEAARIVVRESALRPTHPRFKDKSHVVSIIRMLTAQKCLQKSFPRERVRNIRYAIERAMQEQS